MHPRVQERFRVVSGTLGTRLDGLDRTLGAGDEATVPAGVPHDWWNAGDDDASVLVELSPPDPRFEAMIAALFGLANAGKTNAKGLPGPLQLALVGQEFADVIQFTKPPALVQKLLFGVLGPPPTRLSRHLPPVPEPPRPRDPGSARRRPRRRHSPVGRRADRDGPGWSRTTARQIMRKAKLVFAYGTTAGTTLPWPPPERFAAPFRAVTVLAPSPRRAAATMADAGLRWSAAFAILRRVDLSHD